MSGSNFRSKASNVFNIPGTKASLTNSQLLTSIGSSTLDFFLGGGLAIGTLCIIEEDEYNSYSSLIMKYFLAEGVIRHHSLFLASGEKDPKDILQELPAAKTVEFPSGAKSVSSGSDNFLTQKGGNKTQDSGGELPTPEAVRYCSGTKSIFGLSDNFLTQTVAKTQDLGCELPATENFEDDATPYCGSLESLRFGMLLRAKVYENILPTNDDCGSGKQSFYNEKYDLMKTKELFEAAIQACERAKSAAESDSNKKPSEALAIDNALKIAWRYKNMSLEDTMKAESHNNNFDLTKTMPNEEIEKCTTITWNPVDHMSDEQNTSFLKMPYYDLFQSIKKEILSQGLKTTSRNAETILRVGISSIGTPLWKTDEKDMDELNLVKFLFILKSLLRTAFAVAVVTIPSCLFSNKVLVSRMREVCDTVITMESFVGSDKMSNPLFKDYDGLLHIRKLPVLNTFMYPSMTEDLAFKLKRRGLIIERMHLPPELGDSDQDQPGCSGGGKKLDF